VQWEGLRALSEPLMETSAGTPLVTPTNPKVSATPLSNRFAVTLDGICLCIREGAQYLAHRVL
jgi:hypothetical protein